MVYKVERIKTGISKLDNLIQGGFVKGSAVLISGAPGTGKTIFCLQYIWEGLKRGEPGVYITLEETAEEIRKDALVFGWDLEKYEKSGKFKIVEKDIFEEPDLEFFEIDKLKAKRVVIDSVSLISLIIENKASLRKRLKEIIRSLKKRDVTVLLISESTENSEFSVSGVEEFLVDGVIKLDYLKYATGSKAFRSLRILKMRRTKQGQDIYPMKIESKGIVVGE